MRKKHELAKPESCLNKAKDEEMIFVLLARDKAAGATIRFWRYERIRLGLNEAHDSQMMEALTCAEIMDEQGPTIKKGA